MSLKKIIVSVVQVAILLSISVQSVSAHIGWGIILNSYNDKFGEANCRRSIELFLKDPHGPLPFGLKPLFNDLANMSPTLRKEVKEFSHDRWTSEGIQAFEKYEEIRLKNPAEWSHTIWDWTGQSLEEKIAQRLQIKTASWIWNSICKIRKQRTRRKVVTLISFPVDPNFHFVRVELGSTSSKSAPIIYFVHTEEPNYVVQ